jgi:chromate transporter
MMEEEVVRRRRWLTREQFLDYLGATNIIPGPNSTELAIHIGHARAGWAGLVVAGAAFILPATLIVTAIAWAYVRYGALPAVSSLLYGVKPVVIAVVLQALYGLGRTALKTPTLAALGGAAAVAAALGMNELLILAGGAAFMALMSRSSMSGAAHNAPRGSVFLLEGVLRPTTLVGATTVALAAPFALGTLFLTFAKIGAVLFGSGYVLLAFLRADFVERLGWLSNTQLLDAVAVGQVTPGPVFTTATFIGYVLGGGSGAVVATLGIFLPAFVFVAISGPLVPRIRRSPTAGAILDGVNVASLALIAVVTWRLGRAALIDPLTTVIAVASGIALLRFRVNSAWLVAAGALVGVLARA